MSGVSGGGGGGGRVLIQSADATGVAAVEFLDFVDTKKYSSYELEFFTGSRGAATYNYFYMQLSGDAAAPVWIGGGYYDVGTRNNWGVNSGSEQAGYNNAGQWTILDRGTWPNGIARNLVHLNFGDRPTFRSKGHSYYEDGAAWAMESEHGFLDSAAAIKSLKIYLSGGPNWPSGTFKMFGISGEN